MLQFKLDLAIDSLATHFSFPQKELFFRKVTGTIHYHCDAEFLAQLFCTCEVFRAFNCSLFGKYSFMFVVEKETNSQRKNEMERE